MNIRRFQGWALVVFAAIHLLSLVAGDAPFFGILSIISVILFIVGVPAIQSVQPMGTAGLIGIILIELAAVLALGINLLGGSGVSDAIPFISVFAGALGRIIVGWLTTRTNVFPAWVGWAFFLEALFHLIFWLFDLGTLGSVIGNIAVLLESAALFGYGFGIARRQS